MLEAVVACALAFVLLAAASFRFRRDAGVGGERHVRLLRTGGAAVIALALLRAGTALDGERWVRLLTAASIAAVLVVLALSVAPRTIFYPVRRLLQRG